MRLVWALVAGLYLAGQPAFAQEEFGGGAKGGIGLSTISSDNADAQLFDQTRIGVVIGAFLSVPITDMFIIQPEVLFTQKGAKGEFEGVDLSFESEYVEVPILVNVLLMPESRTRPFFFTGPVPAFRLGVKIKQSIDGNLISEEDRDDDFKSVDFAWTVGGGVRFENLAVEGRYTFSLSGIQEDALGIEDITNRTFAILASIYLN
jgi:hypothetical protein